MTKDIKREIIIKCEDKKDALVLGNAIHEQLRGNPDYVNNRIILNIDTENMVCLIIMHDAQDVAIVI